MLGAFTSCTCTPIANFSGSSEGSHLVASWGGINPVLVSTYIKIVRSECSRIDDTVPFPNGDVRTGGLRKLFEERLGTVVVGGVDDDEK